MGYVIDVINYIASLISIEFFFNSIKYQFWQCNYYSFYPDLIVFIEIYNKNTVNINISHLLNVLKYIIILDLLISLKNLFQKSFVNKKICLNLQPQK